MPRRPCALALAVLLALAPSLAARAAATPRASSPAAVAQALPIPGLGKAPAEAPADAKPEAAAPAEAAAPKAPADAIRTRQAELVAEREALEQSAAPGDEEAGREIERLRRIERVLAGQLAAVERGAELDRLVEEADRRTAAGPRAELGGDPPYSLAQLDRALDTVRSQRERVKAVEAALAGDEADLADARRGREERETARRQAREAAERPADETAAASARRALRAAELASRAAAERVTLAELVLANVRRERELERKKLAAAEAAVEFAEDQLALDPAELAERAAALDRQQARIEEGLEQARLDQKSAERRLAAAQKRFDAAAEPGPALVTELESRRLEALISQFRVELLDASLDRLDGVRRLEERRERALRGTLSRGELRQWEEELQQQAVERGRDRRLLASRLGDVQRELGEIREKIAAMAAPPPGPLAPLEPPGGLPLAPQVQAGGGGELRWLRERERTLVAASEQIERAQAFLDEIDRIAERTGRALAERRLAPSLGERLTDAWHLAAATWNRELFAVQDHSITVGKLVGGLLLFVIGYLLSGWIAALVARVLRRRAALDEGATSAIQSLVFYFLVTLFFLFALRAVNIPLTAFTVLGGALAIGVGFGSQNIVNNFISGIILMIERPIKVGDVVVFDGISGRVERIGPRSTRIRTFDSVHVIVPNAKFLENNVVNWTLADDLIRTRVCVGVAYGSPLRKVEQTLFDLVRSHDGVLAHPEPLVMLVDFGADAVLFEAEFWVRLGLADKRAIESELRHRIAETFEADGVSIAFPQRDVHLDAKEGLAIRILRDGTPDA